jgi:hypothetical protein
MRAPSQPTVTHTDVQALLLSTELSGKNRLQLLEFVRQQELGVIVSGKIRCMSDDELRKYIVARMKQQKYERI